MSKFEMKDMTGVLFRNDKAGNEKRPDYKGECLVENEIFRMSAWVKVMKSDPTKKYLKIKFDRPVAKPADGAPAEQTKPANNEMPFG